MLKRGMGCGGIIPTLFGNLGNNKNKIYKLMSSFIFFCLLYI
jgi:hypothetical protein